MKAATTSLHAYLGTHPEVFMSQPKELDYFVEEKALQRGLKWYADRFSTSSHYQALGEASTNYSKYPTFGGVPVRIKSILPDVRIIYLLRNPLDRLWSHRRHWEYATGEALSATEAVTHSHLRSCSNYTLQLGQYLDHFEPSQLLLITSERLREERASVIARVFNFIGVDDSFMPPNLRLEFGSSDLQAQWKASNELPPELLLQVCTEMAAEIRPLRAFVGDDVGEDLDQWIRSWSLHRDVYKAWLPPARE